MFSKHVPCLHFIVDGRDNNNRISFFFGMEKPAIHKTRSSTLKIIQLLKWFFIKRTLRISCIAPFSHQTNFRRNKRYAFCGRYTSQLRKKSTEKRAREAQTDRESERKQRIFYFQRITEFRLIYSDNFIPFNQASIYTVKYVSQQFCREHTLSIFVSMDRNSKRTKELYVRNWTFPKLLKDSEDEK